MREKLKKLFSYYKPYRVLFYSDMFFAILGAVITLVIPLIVRYITNEVVYFNHHKAMQTILVLGAVMIGLVIVEFGCNYFIAYYGHIMGAYMEADMRSDIFGHYQKLTFACDVIPLKPHFSACRFFQKVEASQKCRFPGTRRSDHYYFFSLFNMLVNSTKHLVSMK